jgi:catechol 2,3-dioxygenase-like lactoylglutathione lyase family enzyme
MGNAFRRCASSSPEDYDEALRFYRDMLGLGEHAEFVSGGCS